MKLTTRYNAAAVRASTPSVTFGVSEEDLNHITRLAKAKGLSRAEYCRDIILREVDMYLMGMK